MDELLFALISLPFLIRSPPFVTGRLAETHAQLVESLGIAFDGALTSSTAPNAFDGP
jgi:hypothetical protein